MQHLDIDEIKINTGAGYNKIIENQAEQMVAKDLLTVKQVESVDLGMIEKFLNQNWARKC